MTPCTCAPEHRSDCPACGGSGRLSSAAVALIDMADEAGIPIADLWAMRLSDFEARCEDARRARVRAKVAEVMALGELERREEARNEEAMRRWEGT